jgi:hypothetical protein
MSAKISLALVAFATIAACCCSGLGGLLGGVEFTTGDFADVPSYPGSTQTTDNISGVETMLGIFNLIGESEWKHYKTPDPDSDILDWYEKVLPTHGWEEASAEDFGSTSSENTLVYTKEAGDATVMLLIMVLPDTDDTGDHHIVIGRIELETEE